MSKDDIEYLLILIATGVFGLILGMFLGYIIVSIFNTIVTMIRSAI